MRRIIVALLLVAALASFALGCGNSANESVTGIWTQTISEDTVQVTVKVTLYQNGSFFFEPPGEDTGFTVTAGQYVISDNKITFTDPDCENSGVYSFSRAGDKLQLTTINDSCLERSDVLSATWNRSGTK